MMNNKRNENWDEVIETTTNDQQESESSPIDDIKSTAKPSKKDCDQKFQFNV